VVLFGYFNLEAASLLFKNLNYLSQKAAHAARREVNGLYD
jgi:hypothetical protein